jgi:membrane fusion protein
MGVLKRMGGRTGPASVMQQARAEVASGTGRVPAVSRPLFRKEVLEFQQAGRQWGRVVPLQPLSTRLMVWSVFFVAAAVIVFLIFAQYARKEVALGYLAPAAGTARVFAPQSGVISAVYAQQGETVERGQPLLAITTNQFTGSGDDVNATILKTLDQHKQALIHEIADEVHRTESERQRLTTQVQEHVSVLGQLDAQMIVQQARIALLEKMVDAGAQLRVKGLVSEVDQRHREETLLEQRQALISLNQQSTTRKGQLSEVRFNLAQLPFVQGEKLQSLRNDLSSTEQRVAEVNGRNAYIVRAPIGGRVSLLQASVGQFADPRRLQMQIVPSDSPLQAELFIPARAIGFVEVGQDVRLLFDSFPYQRFGTYHGRITKVSQTVLLASDVASPIELKEPAYTATVTLDRPDITANGKKIPLQPDMSLKADIILEKRTLVDWIFAPLRHLRMDG